MITKINSKKHRTFQCNLIFSTRKRRSKDILLTFNCMQNIKKKEKVMGIFSYFQKPSFVNFQHLRVLNIKQNSQNFLWFSLQQSCCWLTNNQKIDIADFISRTTTEADRTNTTSSKFCDFSWILIFNKNCTWSHLNFFS